MKEEKVVFTAESSIQKIRNYILDFILVIAIIVCVINFSKNPIVISILIFFLLVAILLLGYNKVIVYENKVEFRFQHPLNRLSRSWIFNLAEIESIDANLQLSKKGFLLLEGLSSHFSSTGIWNTLTIKLTNGQEKVINSKVYKDDFLKVFDIIRHLTKGKAIISV